VVAQGWASVRCFSGKDCGYGCGKRGTLSGCEQRKLGETVPDSHRRVDANQRPSGSTWADHGLQSSSVGRGRKEMFGRGLRRKAGVRMDRNSSSASEGSAALRRVSIGGIDDGMWLTERSLGG
jgi:hypothetical protein